MMPAFLKESLAYLADRQTVLDAFPTAHLLGSMVTDVSAMSAPVQLDWPEVGITGDQVWLQVQETVTYVAAPYDVLQYLLAWTDDYRAGRGWY